MPIRFWRRSSRRKERRDLARLAHRPAPGACRVGTHSARARRLRRERVAGGEAAGLHRRSLQRKLSKYPVRENAELQNANIFHWRWGPTPARSLLMPRLPARHGRGRARPTGLPTPDLPDLRLRPTRPADHRPPYKGGMRPPAWRTPQSTIARMTGRRSSPFAVSAYSTRGGWSL